MSPHDPEAVRVAFLVIDTLERLGIRYHLGGSYASSIHGSPRQTQDVDLIVDMAPEHARLLAGALEADFYVDESAILRAIRERSSFNLIHLTTGVKVDVFQKGGAGFDREEFERSILITLGRTPAREIRVKSPEDTVLRKLLWYRMGHEVSDRQWSDVLGVLRAQEGRLDDAYLRRQAAALEIEDLLERALRET